MFDTLEYAEELKAAGVPEEQARVQARALSRLTEDKLATKDDLAILKTDLAHVEERLRGEITQVETKLSGEIAQVRMELSGEIAQVRTELSGEIAQVETKLSGQIHSLEERLGGQLKSAIAESQSTTLKWVIGLFVTLLGVFIALLKIH